MTNYLHFGDLPDYFELGNMNIIAIDTETMGLKPYRDRLCVLQLSNGNGDAHLIQFDGKNYDAPNLRKLLNNNKILKIFHFGRFDIAVINKYLGIRCMNVYCTKIASKLVRTYTDRHGLKDLLRDMVGVEISKYQQSSDWGAKKLTKEQIDYAASDVLHLHKAKVQLDIRLNRENRIDLANACFKFLPYRVTLDLAGCDDSDIFAF